MPIAKGPRRSPYLLVIAIALGLLSTACSDDADPVTDSATSDAADTTANETNEADEADDTGAAGTGDATAAPAAVTEEDLARFVAASESAIVDSSVEGAVLDAPEIYIAIAQASCARFTQGDTLEQIVNDHLDSTSERSADDEQLIGAVLGAAVETICPEHTDKL